MKDFCGKFLLGEDAFAASESTLFRLFFNIFVSSFSSDFDGVGKEVFIDGLSGRPPHGAAPVPGSDFRTGQDV